MNTPYKRSLHDTRWQEEAKCKDMPPALFDTGWLYVPKEARDKYAENLCKGCPVLAQCSQYTLENSGYTREIVQAGVWNDQSLSRRPYPGQSPSDDDLPRPVRNWYKLKAQANNTTQKRRKTTKEG